MEHNKFDRLFTKNVPHILENILFSLDYKTYKACGEVCQAWKDTLSSEHFVLRATKLLTENDRRLIGASGEGNLAKVRRILSECMVDVNNERQNYGSRSLYIAMDKGYLEVVKLLLDAGADPNQEDKRGRTFIWHPVIRGIPAYDAVKVVRILLDHGANPNKANLMGRTPLHHPSALGFIEMVQVLLEGGADPNKEDNRGKSPLWMASKAEIIKLLREAEARSGPKIPAEDYLEGVDFLGSEEKFVEEGN